MTTKKKIYFFPTPCLQSVVENLLSLEKHMSLLISRFQEYLEFEDIRYYVMASVNENVAKVMQKTKEVSFENLGVIWLLK